MASERALSVCAAVYRTVHPVLAKRRGISPSCPPMQVDSEITSSLRDCASRIQQLVVRHEALLEFRRRQLETAAAITQAELHSETVAGALQGYGADVESYAAELGDAVDAFAEAAAQMRARCGTLLAWYDAHPECHGEQERTQIELLKLARASADLIAHAADAVLIHEAASPDVRKALSHHRQVFQRYRRAVELLENFSVDILRRCGVDVGFRVHGPAVPIR